MFVNRRFLILFCFFFTLRFAIVASSVSYGSEEIENIKGKGHLKDLYKQIKLTTNIKKDKRKNKKGEKENVKEEEAKQETPGGVYGFLQKIAAISFVFTIVEHIIYRILDVRERTEIERMQVVENEKLLGDMLEKYYFSSDRLFDPSACSVRFEELFKNVIGQKEAVEQIRQQFFSHLFKLHNFYSKKKKRCLDNGMSVDNDGIERRGPGVQFYCFVGKPGLGKTFTADLLVEAYCPGQRGKHVFTIDASTILSFEKKNRNPATLFAHVRKMCGGKVICVNSDLFSYIKAAPLGFIVFNEIDKLLKDPELRLLLFEFLRSIKEEGIIRNDRGEIVDCSGLTIFFTSNDPDMFSDQSLQSRFEIIVFHGFSEVDYTGLVHFYLDSHVKNSTNTVQESGRDLSFSLGDEACRQIAAEILSKEAMYSRGIRSIKGTFTDRLLGFLFRFIFPSVDDPVAFNATGEKVVNYKNGEFCLL